MARGCELAREHEREDEKYDELVREFGREEGSKRWALDRGEDQSGPAPKLAIVVVNALAVDSDWSMEDDSKEAALVAKESTK